MKKIFGRARHIAGISLCFLALNGATHSENITSTWERGAYVNFGIDGAPVLEGGYVTPKLFSLLPLDISIAIPTGKLINPWNARIGLNTRFHVYGEGNFKIYNIPGSKIYTLTSPAWSGFSLEVEDRFQVGYFANSFFAALEFGVAPRIFTYVNGSDETKANNPNFKDGFYGKWWQGYYMYGLSGAYSITKSIDIGLRILLTLPMDETVSPLTRSLTDGNISLGVTWRYGQSEQNPEAVARPVEKNEAVAPAKEAAAEALKPVPVPAKKAPAKKKGGKK